MESTRGEHPGGPSRPRRIGRLLLLLAGSLLALNASLKALDFAAFAANVQNYRILPAAWAVQVATAVLVLELTLGVSMTLPRLQRTGSLAVVSLLVIFALVSTTTVLNGIDAECGCFAGGVASSRVGWSTVARDLALACGLLAAISLAHGDLPWRRDPLFRRFTSPRQAPLVLVVVLGLGLTVFLLQRNGIPGAGQDGGVRLRTGDIVSPFALTPLDGGEPFDVDFAEERTLVFVFSTRCPYCARSVAAWNRAFEERLAPTVLGVSLGTTESTERFVAAEGLRFPVFLPVERATFLQDFRAERVPLTVTLDSSGEVRGVQHGLLESVASTD